jgi:hypothetical protein
MTTRQPSQDVIQNYVLPIMLALAVLVVSQLLNLVSIKNIITASALCAVVIVVIFAGQFIAFGALRIHERSALYGVLVNMALSGSSRLCNSEVLSEGDVLGLESVATEVWIYAFALNYERQIDNSFTQTAIANLGEGSQVYLHNT